MNMTKKWIIFSIGFLAILAIGIFAMTSVSAITGELNTLDLGTFEKDMPFNLIMDCSYENGTICSTSATCNITNIKFPGERIIIINKIMGTAYYPSFNLTITNTTNFGIHRGTQYCQDGSSSGVRNFQFEITADGKRYSNYPMPVIILIAGFLALILSFFVYKKRMITYVASCLLMIGGVMSMFPGYNYVDYSTLVGFGTGVIGIGLGAYFLFEETLYGGENSR